MNIELKGSTFRNLTLKELNEFLKQFDESDCYVRGYEDEGGSWIIVESPEGEQIGEINSQVEVEI